MTLNEFYADNPKRERSGELDFGVWWRDSTMPGHTFRISFIQDTGEFYAVDQQNDNVEVIGHAENYDEAEEMLKGWADHCGPVGGMEWAKARLVK